MFSPPTHIRGNNNEKQFNVKLKFTYEKLFPAALSLSLSLAQGERGFRKQEE
jgi:hypothetical protein